MTATAEPQVVYGLSEEHEALRARRGRRQSQPNTFEFADEDGSSDEDEEPTKKNM